MVRKRQQPISGIRFGVYGFRLRKGPDSKEKGFRRQTPGIRLFQHQIRDRKNWLPFSVGCGIPQVFRRKTGKEKKKSDQVGVIPSVGGT